MNVLLLQAYAASKFADACLRGLRGDANVIECSFVASQVNLENTLQFFSSFKENSSLSFILLMLLTCNGNSSQVTELAFFATKVRLGRTGAEEVYQLGPLNEYERLET